MAGWEERFDDYVERLGDGSATLTGARRCGPTARDCCCRASARASSRWRRGSTRRASGGHQSLHHFVAKAEWDEAVLAAVRAYVLPAC